MSTPALYSHTTRSTGTVLTAAIYNSDHQNHITNGTPSQLGGYSASTGEMQSSTTPGSVSSESLAASLAGELERLRYVLRQMGGGTYWYVPAPTDLCQGRLTLTSGTPITTGDVTAAETLYWTPYKGNRVALYDGTARWNVYTFSELSIDVPDATNCYDVFVYDNSGTPALELTAWTNPTTRATALTKQDGVYVKTGATTRRYLGTFYSTTAGNGQIEDSLAKRNLWNYYHRVPRQMKVVDGTNSWSYTTASFQQANASAANQLEYVQGVSEDPVWAEVNHIAAQSGANGQVHAGVGVDSTTVNSGVINILSYDSTAGVYLVPRSYYEGFPGVGRHLLAWLEYSATTTGTTTWYGDNGNTVLAQSGIVGQVIG